MARSWLLGSPVGSPRRKRPATTRCSPATFPIESGPPGRLLSARAQTGEAEAIEQAVGALQVADPVQVHLEFADQRFDVDTVRRGTVVLERHQRLREQVDRAAHGTASGTQMEARGELHEPLEEAPILGGRLAPRLLPHLLGAEVAAAVEEPDTPADSDRDRGPRRLVAHRRSTRGTASSMS